MYKERRWVTVRGVFILGMIYFLGTYFAFATIKEYRILAQVKLEQMHAKK